LYLPIFKILLALDKMWSFWKEPFPENYIHQQVQDKGRDKSYQTKDSRLMKVKELRARSAVENG